MMKNSKIPEALPQKYNVIGKFSDSENHRPAGNNGYCIVPLQLRHLLQAIASNQSQCSSKFYPELDPLPRCDSKNGAPPPRTLPVVWSPGDPNPQRVGPPYATKVESDCLPKKGKKNKEMTFSLFSFAIKAFVVATKKG